MGSNNEVSLRVAEARTRDVGRLIVRIPQRYMRVLGIEPGEYVEIIGNKRSAYAQVWPAYTDDEDKDYIRMDGVLRQNAGVSIGDVVKVKKANLRSAQRVTIAPVGEYIRVDPDYLKRAYLLGKPVWKGSIIEIPYYTGSIRFMVTSVTPGPAAYVGIDTEVQVREEPVREMELAMPRVTWEDIGDLEEAKRKIRELIELPLRHPEIFKHLGIEPPKGVLLIGPPGTGKTLLAKAVASEANAYFVSINGPEIMSKYYGESEAKLREIFEEAKKNAPAIIFIDEIDAIAPKREEVTGEVEKRVVAQLLTLMDGLQERGQVIVIGATNRPEAVDPALRRPGRFDREIYISMPDKNARKEILQVHTRNVPLCTEEDVKENMCDPNSDVVSIDELAEMTHGYTGADLAALVKEAAMIRLREAIEKKEIDLEQSEIPSEQLARIRIRRRDFLEAMKYIQPTVLREVIVEVPEIHWDDIGGYDNVKQELKEMVEWPLRYPRYFEELGIDPPKGILLFGPPGTGKTLLAKAVATESNANFIAVRGPEILSKWFGESERAIREIFKKARMAAPCVIFFDEIDAIAPARGLRVDSGATDRIVNQLLAEMDGIAPLKNVVVIAATNRADIVDPALLRPGRFDRIVYVPPPDENARFEIIKVHIRGLKLSDEVKDSDYKYLKDLARRTEGYTGADLAALVREAAMLALRETIRSNSNQVRPVDIEHFEEALKVVPPSLAKQDIARFEEMARNLRRALRGL
ncbi:MAG: CDC48 family AAA ATPase [Vulcanisaeta sp.]|uniref:AAA family ATPase, possible cell division control protein cdc48 n=1 Tax=Vulcanisaeta moutnovskia (strain 768-28) TaxID=985053 RepID=F0QU91_VULM7|nr:CDC48 family AAA ATPase [Vulcanisaeta moutnovskia]ADY00631.1 AAA family ATPase, possible cell division control protein cdc48 [Vulcanisaeta moutnovskia 768-28]